MAEKCEKLLKYVGNALVSGIWLKYVENGLDM